MAIEQIRGGLDARISGDPLSEHGQTQEVLFPPMIWDPRKLRQDGYDSVGVDIVLATVGPYGEPHFLHEHHRKFGGALAHPKETMQRDGSWRIESLDDAVARCFSEELTRDVEDLDLRADSAGFVTEAVTYKTTEERRKKFHAMLVVLWTPDFDWAQDPNTEEVTHLEVVSLDEILNGDPQRFRESTRDIYTTLVNRGFFERSAPPEARLRFQSHGHVQPHEFIDIDLAQYDL